MIRSHTHGGDNGRNRILRLSTRESLVETLYPQRGEGWQLEALLRLTKVDILVLERALVFDNVVLKWHQIEEKPRRSGDQQSRVSQARHCEGLCPNKGALSTATTPPPTWGLGADGRHDRPACPRPPTSTMTLSPIDKLLVAGDNETRDGGRSPEHLLPVLNIIRHIYFIISPSLARLRFIIHHIYYGGASPI